MPSRKPGCCGPVSIVGETLGSALWIPCQSPWRVWSRVTEHLSFIMDSSSVEKPDSRQASSAKRQFGESMVDSPDHDKEGKKAQCLSQCSDK